MFNNRKGITPIISVILLLMMTIAIAGLAYTWLQRMQTTVQTSSENVSDDLLAGFKVRLDINGYSANCTGGSTDKVNLTVYVKNSGTKDANHIQLYVNDAMQAGANQTVLATGNDTTFNLTNVLCSSFINETKIFKVTSDETVSETSFFVRCSDLSTSKC